MRDLQWAGRARVRQPLVAQAACNSDANQILTQPVTYRNAAGQAVTVPLNQTRLNLYFRIDALA